MKRKVNEKIKWTLGILICVLLVAIAFSSAVAKPIKETMEEKDTPCGPKPTKLFNFRILNRDWDYWTNPPHLFSIPEGNVGIGTENPRGKLEVTKTNMASLRVIPEDDAVVLAYGKEGFTHYNLRLYDDTSGFATGLTVGDYYLGETPPSSGMLIEGNVGIGIDNPLAKFHVEDGAVLFNGTTGTTPTSGAGTRFMWIPSKAAFRAGCVWGSQWDNGDIGMFSVAMGRNSIASGLLSTAMGEWTTASGGVSTAMGCGTTASGDWSTAVGKTTVASGDYSTAMGFWTTASGLYSTAMGRIITVDGENSVGIGLDYTWPPWNVSDDHVMSIMGGNVGIGTTSPESTLHVNGTINLDPTSEPASPSAGFVLFCDSADGKLKAKSSTGTVSVLADP